MTYILRFTVPKIQTDTDFSGESTLYQLVGRDHWRVTRSTCGKMTPTTETVRVVRGQWSHISGGGTHVQTCKHVPAARVRMHTAPTSQGQPGHTRRQRCMHVCEAPWNVTDQSLRKPLCRHAPPREAHSASTSLARAASPDRRRLHDPTLSPSPRDATESACLMAHLKTTGY